MSKFHDWLKTWKPIHLCWLFEKYNKPVPKYFIGTSDAAPQYEGSRISNATRTWQADEDNSVTDWSVGSDFCISVAWGAQSGTKSNSRELRLRWRNVTDSGSFADLGSSGELTYSADTSLVNANELTEAESGLVASQATYVAGEEREGANAYTYTSLANDSQWTACMWAINCDNAHAGDQYEFELYNQSDTAQIAVCTAKITMGSAPADVDVDMSGANGESVTVTDVVVGIIGAVIISTFSTITIDEPLAKTDINIGTSQSETVTVTESGTITWPTSSVYVDEWVNVEIEEGDVAINVYDEITLTEAAIAALSDLGISVFETVTVTEERTAEVVTEISVYDVVTVTEDTGRYIPVSADVLDQVTVTEYAASYLPFEADVYDEVTVTEDVTVELDDLEVNAYDSVEVTEDSPVSLDDLEIDLLDTINVTEDRTVSVSEEGETEIDLYDDITVTEAAVADIPLDAELYDSVTLSEAGTITWPTSSVYVDEYVEVSIEAPGHNVDLYEDVTVTEDITIELSDEPDIDNLSVSETITVTEYVVFAIEGEMGDIDLSEDINVSESGTITWPTSTVYVDEWVDVLLFEQGPAFYAEDDVTVTEGDVVVEIAYPPIEIFVYDVIATTISIEAVEDVTVISDEEVTVYPLGEYQIQLEELVEVTDIPTVSISPIEIFAFDEIQVLTWKELDMGIGAVQVSVEEDVTISESVEVYPTPLEISVSDVITVTEYAEYWQDYLEIDVSDTVTVTEIAIASSPEEILLISELKTEVELESDIATDIIVISEIKTSEKVNG